MDRSEHIAIIEEKPVYAENNMARKYEQKPHWNETKTLPTLNMCPSRFTINIDSCFANPIDETSDLRSPLKKGVFSEWRFPKKCFQIFENKTV